MTPEETYKWIGEKKPDGEEFVLPAKLEIKIILIIKEEIWDQTFMDY